MRARTMGLIALVGSVGFAACEDATGVEGPETETALMSVAPEGGASNVAPDEEVVVRFDRAMHDHAADYADVHEGNVNGPAVSGSWTMEEDGTVLRFTPAGPWDMGTEYTLHLGGGIMDADRNHVDFEAHGEGMGGKWADSLMMGDGMQGDGMGGGHLGEGWQHEDGSYGMVFSFTTAGTAPSSALMAVEPQGGATDVDPTEPVVVTFDHALDPAMTEYAALHEGDVNGPEVAGTWTLSEDSTQMVFTQDEPLKPATQYTVHLGGNMMDAEGHHVDLGSNGTHMGGEWATGSMMGDGMMGGEHEHMGGGWEHPDNGSYGMTFSFTTDG